MALNNIMNIVWPFNRRKLFFVVLIIFEEDSGLAHSHSESVSTLTSGIYWMLTSRVWGLTGRAAQNHPTAGCRLALAQGDSIQRIIHPSSSAGQPFRRTDWKKTAFLAMGQSWGIDCLNEVLPGGEPLESRAHGPMEDTNLANCLRTVINNWMLWNTSIKL